ncbi:benzoate 4-monooxygenase cytochrome P450 [Dactylonectria macrodidyma]|uniref:Benzoate 4-monooxygenase cytochrome P450 n=1 Tax=Dactylonectria macrodidyma TaxID=307937 RepID=A0A9P9J7T5_9HYPO|nr:benzoate 4-monooxygenase cytochrome P450 [Dactylonectria macrodidyma]
MVDLQSTQSAQAAFAVGVALHLFLFRFGEWDLATTKIITTAFLSYVALGTGLWQYFPAEYPSPLNGFAIASRLGGALILGLVSSMMLYRGFFHRLRRFPGPFMARFSNFYVTSLSAKNLHLYEEIQSLHKKYGDYVRIGPSEISINDPKAVSIIHSAQSKCGKGPWYNVLHPMVSLQMIRNKSEHIKRRKVWDRGFSAKALRDYEPRVIKHTENFMRQLEKMDNAPVNITDWFNFYSFDVMGDLAWGKSFGMVDDGIKHYFMTSLHLDMKMNGLFSHMLWLFPIVKATPILNSEHKKFWNWVNSQVQERRKIKPESPDVFSWILESHDSLSNPTAQNEMDLVGDAYLIAVAGSDTTAASLTCLFFELALHPESFKELQKEIDTFLEGQEQFDTFSLSKLTYLDAVINETLRLHPPVPSGLQRMTPPEGLAIGDKFIPGNTIVQIPTYTMFRDARLFERPDEFIPERWTTRKELNKDPTVFVPFSTGRYSCIGKQLGLMEVRYMATRIIQKYDIALAADQNPQKFVEGKKDTFTLALSPLRLAFTRRKRDT